MASSPVIAIIGDVVRSRDLGLAERAKEQARLEATMTHINTRYRKAVLAQFLVTLGDEFQGLLRLPGAIPDIVQDVRERLPRLRFRIAVSRGTLTTPIKRMALGTDGPAWHAARALLDGTLKTREGVAFAGFGDDDLILDGIADLLTSHWMHLEDSQRAILTTLRAHDAARKDIARKLKISPQALSNRAQSAGWREYSAGIAAWRALLERHPVPTKHS